MTLKYVIDNNQILWEVRDDNGSITLASVGFQNQIKRRMSRTDFEIALASGMLEESPSSTTR